MPQQPEVIDSFRGEHFFLSNFYMSPIVTEWYRTDIEDVLVFPSGEHMFAYSKLACWDDGTRPQSLGEVMEVFSAIDEFEKQWRKEILSAATPQEAKRLGREIPLNVEQWDTESVNSMASVVDAKFNDPDMALMLIGTGDAVLIEGNTWGDTKWGVCNGVGENLLGRTLMWKRDKLNGKVE